MLNHANIFVHVSRINVEISGTEISQWVLTGISKSLQK